MKRYFVFLVVTFMALGVTISAHATPYFQITDANGTGTINYDNTFPLEDPPEFTFSLNEGTSEYDFSGFTPGQYTINFLITNLEIDANEDGNWFTVTPYYQFISPTFYLSALPPLSGQYGQLSWDINTTNQKVWLSYDFGNTGTFTNQYVNSMLALLDYQYSGQSNGVMDANIKWDKLRIELNRSPAPVPEPSTFLLLGAGLLGIGLISRRQFKKA